jgi:hypothetical protein
VHPVYSIGGAILLISLPLRDQNTGMKSKALDLTSVIMVSVFDGDQERSRYFCTPDGKLLFEGWFVIY